MNKNECEIESQMTWGTQAYYTDGSREDRENAALMFCMAPDALK